MFFMYKSVYIIYHTIIKYIDRKRKNDDDVEKKFVLMSLLN